MRIGIRRLVAIAALAVMAIVPLVAARGGFQYSHDNFRYPVLLNLYAKQLTAEGFPVRWLPDLAGGHGYPTFVYYPQAFFLFASGFKLMLGLPDVIALTAATWTCLFVAGLAMYLVGRRLSGHVAGGVISCSVFLLAPWIATDFVVRGDLAEASALCAGAVTLAVALALADENRERPRLWLRVIGPVAFAAPLVLHPMGGVMAGIVATCVAVARSFDRARAERSWSGLGLAVAGGFAMGAWYLVPLITMQDLVHIDRTTEGYYKAVNHVVEPMQLLSGPYGYGGSAPGPADEMSFALGWPVIAAALVGFAARTRATMTAAMLVVVTCLVMTRWFEFLWVEPSPLVKLQFSWRLLGLALLAAATAASACGRYQRKTRRILVGVFIVLIVLFQRDRYAKHPRVISYGEAQRIVKDTVATLNENDERFAGSNEFDPRGSLTMAPRRGQAVISDAHGPLPYSTKGTEMRFSLSRDQGADIRIAQYHFPGWDVTVDGRRLPSPERTPEGTIRVSLPPGPPADVSIRYSGVPLDRWLLPLAALTPCAVLLLSWRRVRRPA